MDREPLTPDLVQDYLRRIADIDISLEEAAAVAPIVESNRTILANLDRSDVQEARPATMLDPASASRPAGGA
jgi:hypothetical protein